MKITKYEHSCLDVLNSEDRLVIDPGCFSTSFTNFSNIVALVLTHIHQDHFDKTVVSNIVTNNPDVTIFAPGQVAREITMANITVPQIGKSYTVKSFVLEFFGGKHELYEDFENIAVMINGTLFHPGDSYTIPNQPITLLAAPAAAPWLRVTEASKFIKSCRAEIVIPIHDAVLSKVGQEVHYRILGEAAKEAGSKWHVLEPSESIEV